jgi:zinc transport system permease protein
MRVFSNFRAVTISSAVVSVCCFLVGMMLSCVYSLPTGAGIVGVNLLVFLLFSAVGAARE